MNRLQTLASVIGALAAASAATVGQLAGPGGFDLSWSAIDGGGGASTGSTFGLSATIAQPDAGVPMAGGGFALAGGFWTGVSPACIADITGNSIVNVDDLLAVINSWGACDPGSCPTDIAPPGGNGLVNVDDLLGVINAWGACP